MDVCSEHSVIKKSPKYIVEAALEPILVQYSVCDVVKQVGVQQFNVHIYKTDTHTLFSTLCCDVYIGLH